MKTLTSGESILLIGFSLSMSLYLLITTLPLIDLPEDEEWKALILVMLFTIPIWFMTVWVMEQIKK